MTEYLQPTSASRILEIGTGCGYQTAVLAEIVRQVYTVEFSPELQERARIVLERLRYSNIAFRIGDGHRGWPEEAPFDGIIVTAAADEIPRELEQQLVEGGRMVIPVQKGAYGSQELVLVEKSHTGVIRREGLYAVRFVNMQRPE
jgi:protein-L-isoaspartate(D-aspartate) O-methyltransferase